MAPCEADNDAENDADAAERRISAAVTAWRLSARRDGHGDGAAVLLALEGDERREALRRLGYDSPAALEAFGLG